METWNIYIVDWEVKFSLDEKEIPKNTPIQKVYWNDLWYYEQNPSIVEDNFKVAVWSLKDRIRNRTDSILDNLK